MKLFKNLGIVSASLTFICLSGSNVLKMITGTGTADN